jgi:N-methylhydantoinase A/oxoprolinase/acetone carboxylase beta subunit
MPYYTGTDIGGTFTDCVVLDDKGRIRTIRKNVLKRPPPTGAKAGPLQRDREVDIR